MRSFKVQTFDIDRNIAFAIQGVTGDSTQEILGYFYGQASYVLEDIMKKSTATYVEKNIVLFYKETPLTYKLQIKVSLRSETNNNAYISVSYPKSMETQNVSELMDKIVENGLGLTEEEPMPLFEKPILKTPACLTKVRKAQYAERTKASIKPVQSDGQRDGENA